MSTVSVPVSYGELLDKITILEIKSERITDPDKNANVQRELDLLSEVWQDAVGQDEPADARRRLRSVNVQLWEIEDAIRLKEKAGAFDDEFVKLARSVYITNGRRDYAVVLAALGGVRVHAWDGSPGSWRQ